MRRRDLDGLGRQPAVGSGRVWAGLAVWFLAVGRANGVPYSVMARAFGVTRSTIAGAIRRHVNPVHVRRGPVSRRLRRGPSDRRFIETWAERKLRRARERAAFKRPPRANPLAIAVAWRRQRVAQRLIGTRR